MKFLPHKLCIATVGALLLLAGSGSASAYDSAPTITHLICPDYNNSGGGIYFCRVIFSSSTPATIRWPDGSDQFDFMGVCKRGQRPTVTVSVTNAAGSSSRTNTFTCPTGPIP